MLVYPKPSAGSAGTAVRFLCKRSSSGLRFITALLAIGLSGFGPGEKDPSRPAPNLRQTSAAVRHGSAAQLAARPATALDMTGKWEIVIYSNQMLSAGKEPKKSSAHVRGTLNLTQTDGKILGTFASYGVGCRTGEVTGTATNDMVDLAITCTKGTCLGSAGLGVTGKLANTTIIGEAKPTGPAPEGKCTVFAGKMTLTRKP